MQPDAVITFPKILAAASQVWSCLIIKEKKIFNYNINRHAAPTSQFENIMELIGNEDTFREWRRRHSNCVIFFRGNV